MTQRLVEQYKLFFPQSVEADIGRGLCCNANDDNDINNNVPNEDEEEEDDDDDDEEEEDS